MAAWETLGQQFVKQYYQQFDSMNKEALMGLYHSTAMLTFEGNQVQGHAGIKELLENKLRFQTIQHSTTHVDCQPTAENGVVIFVIGRLKTDDDPPHDFSQVFYIRPADGSYFIFHEMFRLSLHNA